MVITPALPAELHLQQLRQSMISIQRLNLIHSMYILRALATSLALALATTALAQPVLNTVTGHAYEAVFQRVTWDQAVVLAAQRSFMGMPGHLATFTSAEETQYVFNNLGGNEALRGLHIGGLQSVFGAEPAGGWMWITSEPWNYENWAASEPNEFTPGEDVLQIVWNLAAIGTLGWSDIVSSSSAEAEVRGYLVEYTPIPEPSTYAAFAGALALAGAVWRRSRKV